MNGQPIRILMAEDLLTDAELAEREIRKVLPAYIVERVETRVDFLAALKDYQPDLIISDYNMPRFDGMTALKLSLQHEPLTPVIIWTGSLNEDIAVECMKAGAANYVIKENIKRLGPAVVHALGERQLRLERWRAEEALRQAEAKYRELVERLPLVVYTAELGARGVWKYISPQIEQMLGFTPQEWMADSGLWYRQMHPADRDRQQDIELYAYERGEPFVSEYRIFARDGRQVWIHDSAQALPALTNGGAPIMQGVLEDITEHKNAQDERMRLAAILEATPDFVATTDVNGNALYYNQSARRMLGIGDDEAISGIHIADTHPEWANQIVETQMLPAVFQEGMWSGETALLSRDGREIPILQVALAHKQPNGKIEFLSTIARDITERKQAEAAVLKRATELAVVAEISAAATKVLDINLLLQKTVDLTKAGFKLYHAQVYLLDEARETLKLAAGADDVGRTMLENSHSISMAAQRSLVAWAARMGQSIIANNVMQNENFLPNPLLPDTRSELAVPLMYGDRVLGVLDAQSERRDNFSDEDIKIQSTLAAQIANAVQNARQYERIRATVADLTGVQNAINSGAIVSITDSAGAIEFVNENFIRLSQYTRDELIGQNHRILKSGYHSWDFFRNMWDTIVNGKTWRGEVCNEAKDGSLFWADTTISPILDESGMPVKFISVRFDITERKNAEYQLIARTKELESLFEISKHVRSAQTADEILLLVLNATQRVLAADAGAIFLLDDAATCLVCAFGVGGLAVNKTRILDIKDSIGGYVLQALQPYLTNDLANHPQKTSALLGCENLGPAIVVPLQSETQVLGVFVVAREKYRTMRQFSSAEVQLLTAISEMTGNALRRTQLYDDALRRLERMHALLNIDIAIASTLDARQILYVLLFETISQLQVDAADVLLINRQTDQLEYRAGRGFRTPVIEQTSLRIGETVAGSVALDRQTQIIQDLSMNQKFARTALVAAEGFRSYIGMPLITKGDVIGVLEIFGRAPLVVSSEWMDYLTSLATRAAISIENSNLFTGLQRKNLELTQAYEATIEGWSRALELREQETERHTARVMDMTLQLARLMGLPDDEIVHIRRGALLHDIGKMGIPDAILLKPSGLTEAEWKIMRKHPQYAYEMLRPIEYLAPALDIPYCHHEHWDGAGYPRGLKGDEIPLSARIFTLCDVWDAVTNDRPYRKAWSKEEAIGFIYSRSGSHFDPKVVSAFQELINSGYLAT